MDLKQNRTDIAICFTIPNCFSTGYPLIGNPIKMSECSLTYRKSPPSLGEDTSIVLKEELGLSEKEVILAVQYYLENLENSRVEMAGAVLISEKTILMNLTCLQQIAELKESNTVR